MEASRVVFNERNKQYDGFIRIKGVEKFITTQKTLQKCLEKLSKMAKSQEM